MILFVDEISGRVIAYKEGFDNDEISIGSTIQVVLEAGSSLDYLARQFDDPTNERDPMNYQVFVESQKVCIQNVSDETETHWLEAP